MSQDTNYLSMLQMLLINKDRFLHLWLVSCDRTRKVILQRKHSYGFSPVWMRRCSLRARDCVKPLWQTSHMNGLSFVWIRQCSLSAFCWVNAFSQTSHLKRRSWFRDLLCRLYSSSVSNLSEHVAHLYRQEPFSLSRIAKCCFNSIYCCFIDSLSSLFTSNRWSSKSLYTLSISDTSPCFDLPRLWAISLCIDSNRDDWKYLLQMLHFVNWLLVIKNY